MLKSHTWLMSPVLDSCVLEVWVLSRCWDQPLSLREKAKTLGFFSDPIRWRALLFVGVGQ